MDHTVIAVDTAKKVFQLHWVEHDTGSIERLQLKRARLLEWFAIREPSLVVMEACGGAHEWARALTKLGHEVRLISPRKVRPFVQRNKTDAADAQAIWTACQHAWHALCSSEDPSAAGSVVVASDSGAAHEEPHHANQRTARHSL